MPRPYGLWPVASGPSGLTLVEMLMAMAITLIMMAAVVNLFANVGASVRNRRATIEMSGQLRMVRMCLHNDLVGATCPTLTWQRPGDDNGYLEIVEGQWSDKNPSGLLVDGDGDGEPDGLDVRTSLVPSSNAPNIPKDWVTDGHGLGDYDDILALTVRSEGEPFVGRGRVLKPGSTPANPIWIDTTIESTLAEVIWYAVENPADGSLGEPGMRTVYRRVLLIAPWTEGAWPVPSGTTVQESLRIFYRHYDVAVRIENGRFVPNMLGDLTKREFRFAHEYQYSGSVIVGFPHAMNLSRIRFFATRTGPLHPFGSPGSGTEERQGEDMMLSDVLAFDVRVYDPGALLRQEPVTGVVLEPCDSGWDPNLGTLAGCGAYVDLGWYPNYPAGGLAGVPGAWYPYPRQVGWHPRNPASGIGYPAVYDTWSFHYENDGLDQDNRDNDDNVSTGADEGTNGLDDDNQNGVDDMGERETAPPYDVPLRGLQVKLRVYEPDTRNIRETTVTRNFVP